MSQVNYAVTRIERRGMQRAITAMALVAAMAAVAAFQLRQEAARTSPAAPHATLEAAAPTR